MVDDHIARASADAACFLEFKCPPLIDEYLSVRTLEQMAYELCQSDDSNKRHLSILFKKIAPIYGEHADFVRSLPDSFGFF